MSSKLSLYVLSIICTTATACSPLPPQRECPKSNLIPAWLPRQPSMPTCGMNVREIITYYGYPVETHYVTTEDGYILQMERIPYGKNKSCTEPRQPVLLAPGVLCAAIVWVWNEPENNLAFVLADACFDVWMINWRGSNYSQNHTTLSPESSEFWNFGYDECIQHDLPSAIDTVLRVTKFSQLSLIGHSMGTTVFFGLLSSVESYNKKIKSAVLLAPTAYINNSLSPLKYLMYVPAPVWDVLKLILHGKLPAPAEMPENLVSEVCQLTAVTWVCKKAVMALAGPDYHWNEARVPYHLSGYPDSTSIRTIQQYAQAAQSGNLQHFDFGREMNLKKYGQETPPLYDVTKITTPMSVFWGGNDWMADPKGVAILLFLLKNVVYNASIADYNHGDFIWGDNTRTVYDKIVEQLLK